MRVVFIMIDTLRYDFLKMGGAKLPYAPEIDKLAEGAFACEQHYISSFPTVPNREDIMTGRFSFPHHGWGPLPKDMPVLPHIPSHCRFQPESEYP